MSTNLLTTKFYCPTPRQNLVNQGRLIKQLDSGLYQSGGFLRKLTLVSAPAGYGKTTLISDWLSQNHPSRKPGKDDQTSLAKLEHPDTQSLRTTLTSWLSLDEAENDPTRFLIYLIASLKHADEKITGKTDGGTNA